MIIALSGPSGIGKGFIKGALKEFYPEIKEIVWLTTRELRPDELVDSNREHVSEEELMAMMAKDELVLVQGVFGHRYAVRKADLLLEDGIFLTEIHPFVVGELKEINSDVITVGLITDDFELLRDRLANRRKTETVDAINERIQSAKVEVKAIRDNLKYYDETITITRENEDQIVGIAQKMFAKYYGG